MNDFLQFLNTASADSLTKIPGVSQSLAENLIAARPFNSIEDCLKVRGMGKNLLARAQASFEKEEVVPQENAILPVEQPEPQGESRLEKSPPMAETPPSEPGPSTGPRLGQVLLWFFRALLRLILIVLVIGGIGAAIYYGAPFINERFVAPVEQNSARVTELETEVETLRTQVTEINSQLTEVNTQLSEVSDQLTDANTRVAEIEQSVDAHTASLAKLEQMQSALENQLQESNDRNLLALKREVMITRVLDTLARARLYLAQSNFGLAKEDVQSARDLLDELLANSQDEVLSQALTRLDLALGNLPDFPVVASGDLDIAWQILMTGKAHPTMTPEPASTPLPNATSTPTPGAIPTP
jgi:cell division protein FtsB